MFVALLFCGQRRQHDIQHSIEIQLHQATPSFELVVLAVDILLDKEKGDLTRAGTLQLWSGHVRAGRVIALGGGPPCETFSTARWREGGPPPLRTWQAPWGLTALTPRQRLQLQVSNDLFQASIELLSVVAVCNAIGWLEHPAPPSWEPRCVPSWHVLPAKALIAMPASRFLFFLTNVCLGSLGVPPRRFCP